MLQRRIVAGALGFGALFTWSATHAAEMKIRLGVF